MRHVMHGGCAVYQNSIFALCCPLRAVRVSQGDRVDDIIQKVTGTETGSCERWNKITMTTMTAPTPIQKSGLQSAMCIFACFHSL